MEENKELEGKGIPLNVLVVPVPVPLIRYWRG